jgi:hypothetical protein
LVSIDALLYIPDYIRRMDGQNFLKGEQVVEIPYSADLNALVIEPFQFFDDVPDNSDILAESVFVVGVTTERMIEIYMEAKGDVDFMGCTGRG